MNETKLSFLMCYRTPDRSDNQISITEVLNNLQFGFKPEDRKKIEVLIKIDADDTLANNLFSDRYLNGYDYDIRVFSTDRANGRWAFNYHQMYLFSKINPNSRYVGILTDDQKIHPKIKYLFEEIEQDYNDLDYVFFCDSPYQENSKHSTPFLERLGTITDIKSQASLWCTSYLIESCPIVTTKLLEVMGNCGWQVNIDATLGLLNVILYHDYKINIAKVLGSKWFQREDTFRMDKNTVDNFHVGFHLDASTPIVHPMLLKLTEQQAKNIYLNMKEEGVLEKYRI